MERKSLKGKKRGVEYRLACSGLIGVIELIKLQEKVFEKN